MVEIGLYYKFKSNNGLHEYHYTRVFTPSGEKFRTSVYLIYPGGDLLLRLLNHWNRGDTNWKYYSGHN